MPACFVGVYVYIRCKRVFNMFDRSSIDDSKSSRDDNARRRSSVGRSVDRSGLIDPWISRFVTSAAASFLLFFFFFVSFVFLRFSFESDNSKKVAVIVAIVVSSSSSRVVGGLR